MLQSDREAYRRQGKVMPNPTRITKVCRVACVAQPDPTMTSLNGPAQGQLR